MNACGVVLAILLSGADAAAAAPGGLHEIDHVPITDDLCTNVIVHANAAIAAALRDDDMLAKTIERLRGTDLDADRPARRTTVAELTKYGDEIAGSADRGRAEIKRIAAILADAPNGRHAREGRAFTAALASALERQASLGQDLDAFLHALDVAALRATDLGDDPMSRPHEPPREPFRTDPAPATFPPQQRVPSPHDLAGDFTRRMSAVAADEARAAQVTGAAVTGC